MREFQKKVGEASGTNGMFTNRTDARGARGEEDCKTATGMGTLGEDLSKLGGVENHIQGSGDGNGTIDGRRTKLIVKDKYRHHFLHGNL